MVDNRPGSGSGPVRFIAKGVWLSVHVTWLDIVLRLAAALLAGGVIGYDRGTRGRAAGLRTTILMCLAATGAMIVANLMLAVDGKTPSSFSVMDTLRFPLGILSGVGFIGAGAIVRRGRLVTGVTTAATLWLITVVGLIVGAGYIGLGLAITAIAFAVLYALKRIEPRLYREHRAVLTLRMTAAAPSVEAVRALLVRDGYRIAGLSVDYRTSERLLRIHLQWHSSHGQTAVPAVLDELRALGGVETLSWHPIGAGHLIE
jgi:putative Mg2+ transporter-C (MgtC) family protein